MATRVNKAAQITKFINDVINPAVGFIDVHSGNIPGGGGPGSAVNPILSVGNFTVNPNSFTIVPSIGGQITASALADIFQHYAYNLTAIRRANIRRYVAQNVRPPASGYYSTISTNRITALSANFRMSTVAFNAAVTAAPNPLANLQPGNIASSTALDDLIARLASVVSNFRNSAATNVSICHSACHSSRGRR